MIPEAMYQALLAESKKIGVFGHGFTYGGHPVSAAVALKAIEIYARDRIVENAAARAPQFQARLKALGEHPLVGEARGLGLIGGVELVADKRSKRSFAPQHGVGARAVQFAEAEGLIVRAVLGDVLTLSPPLIIGAAGNRRIVRPAHPRARQDARLGDPRAARAVVMGDNAHHGSLLVRSRMNTPFTTARAMSGSMTDRIATKLARPIARGSEAARDAAACPHRRGGSARPVGDRDRRLCRRDRAAGPRRHALCARRRRLAGGPQAHHHRDRRPPCRRARHDAVAHPRA